MSLNGRNRDTLKYLKGEDYKKMDLRGGSNPVKLLKALERVYTIKDYGGSNCLIPVPCCLRGMKVKLILLGGNNK